MYRYMCVCISESFCCLQETNTILWINNTSNIYICVCVFNVHIYIYIYIYIYI